MTAKKIPTRGPRLRIVCVNDVYTLENLPRLLNLVQHHRTTDPADLFLTTLAGDFVGPSMLSSLDKGRGMLDSLNLIGITHLIFGNHEDDISIEDLRARIAEFRGTWLNTNMPSFVPKLPDQQVLEIAAPDGRRVRVGLIGVVMPDETVYRRKPFGGAKIAPANATALQATQRLLQEEHCACVIPLTHQNAADDFELARTQTAPPFPIIIGGHEHQVFLEQVAGTWIIKAGADAHSAVIVDLVWPAEAPQKGPDLPAVQVQLEAVAKYPEDEAMRAMVNARMMAVKELEHATLIKLAPEQVLSSVGTRCRQTSLGTLLCSRIRDLLNSDGCLLNGGGIRANREYRDHFSYGDLKAEVPFDNEVAVVVLPGSVIREAIAASRAHAPDESGGFLQVDDRMAVSEPDHLLTAIGGAPLVEDHLYRIAIMRDLMNGLDHIEPLVRYAKAHPECLPNEGSGREIKVVLVDAFSRELWEQLGSFESIDTNRDGTLSEGEIADAVSRVTSAPASKITVDFLLRAADVNQDRTISREEVAGLGKKDNSAAQGKS